MITLLTDFGTADYFVGSMKGVILSIHPDATIVDITHEIPPYDIEAAAFTLLAAYRSFHPKTIHLAVVDPGVGSERRPILVATGNYFFIGPDNGIFSYVLDREKGCVVYHLNNASFFRHPVSNTFHGRDIFAAVAGELSKGADPIKFGVEIKDYERLLPLTPIVKADGEIEARVIHVDHFGNCVTNVTHELLAHELLPDRHTLRIARREINSFRRFYSEANCESGELFTVWGSAGFLEVVAFRDSAARILAVERGEPVVIANLK